MEKIDVVNNIMVKIGTQEFLLTKEEAENLQKQLADALNINNKPQPFYYIPLINEPFWDYTVKCNSGTKKEN